jgi:HK97 family phage prohead protease
MSGFMRSYPLEDITIRSGGDGRTVEAYAAVFDIAVEIQDQQGHYMERLAPTAFNKTIADNGTRFGVFYNHASTIYGTPSERFSIPLGKPIEVRADARGLLTVTRYNKTPLADEILAAIDNGDITGQSFQGRFVSSDKPMPKYGYRAASDGSLTVVTRTEVAMKEYGPTPFPAYAMAEIVGVRSSADLVRALRDMDPAERDEFRRLFDFPAALLDGAARDASTSEASEAAVSDEPPATAQHSGQSYAQLRAKARRIGAI